MEPSSPGNEPKAVEERELYDGPKVMPLRSGKATLLAPNEPSATIVPPTAAALVTPIPPIVPPANYPSVSSEDAKSRYLTAVGLALDILSTKLHALLVLVAAVGIWGYAVVSPEPWRLAGACAYSILVILPMLVVYWKSGTNGDGGLQ